MKKIYLDYASTTPLDTRVLKAMMPYFKRRFGNTMSLHRFGQEAKIALEKSRKKVASLIAARAKEIIFTSSATESNNLALKGIAWACRKKGKHIIISKIEHPSVEEPALWLENQGFEITRAEVDSQGLINIRDLEKLIRKDTVLVSIIHSSNEIGTVQSIEQIGKICREARVYFHTDASQSLGKIKIDAERLKIDLLTGSSHKIYGPKGCGFLYVKEGTKIEPILHGGLQETGLRSSTVNVPLVVGFARACDICKMNIGQEPKLLSKLRDKIIQEVLKIEGAHLTGHPKNRLPNNASFWFSGIDGSSLTIRLDLEGFAVSTGAACSAIKFAPSQVLLATGLSAKEAAGSLRISLGRQTAEKEINNFLKVLPKAIKELRG